VNSQEPQNDSRWGFRGMTVRNWLELLVVPLVLLGIGLLFQIRQSEVEERRLEAAQHIEEQRAQDEALQTYLEQMGQMLLDKDRPLRQSKEGDEVQLLARARTVTILRRLDSARNRDILQFLREARLVPSNRYDIQEHIVRLDNSNLSKADLRRLMCNELYEQIRQVAQRSAERVVDLLCAGVGRDLGGQARQQPSQRLRTMTLQREEVLELAYDPFYDLALARGPAPIGLRPRPAGVVFRGGRNERSVKLHPQPLPLEPREALVGQVRSVAVGSYEGVAYGPLVGGRDGQPESGDHPLGVNHEGHLEAVYPLGLGGAASEACLAGEKPLARSPHPHDGRDEGSVHHAVDRRRFRKILGESPLQEAQLWLQGSNAPVELALGAQPREVGAQVRPREAPEVALAAKARPLGEDRQRQDLLVAQEGGTAGAACGRGVVGLPPVVYLDVQ